MSPVLPAACGGTGEHQMAHAEDTSEHPEPCLKQGKAKKQGQALVQQYLLSACSADPAVHGIDTPALTGVTAQIPL